MESVDRNNLQFSIKELEVAVEKYLHFSNHWTRIYFFSAIYYKCFMLWINLNFFVLALMFWSRVVLYPVIKILTIYCLLLARGGLFCGHFGLKFIYISNLFSRVNVISDFFICLFRKVQLNHLRNPFQVSKLTSCKGPISILLFFVIFNLIFLRNLKCKHLYQAFFQCKSNHRMWEVHLKFKTPCHSKIFVKPHIWIFCNYLQFLLILYALRFYIFWNKFVNVMIFWVIIKSVRGHDKIAELIVFYGKIFGGAILDFKDIDFFLEYNYLLIEHCSRLNIDECLIDIRLFEFHPENLKTALYSAVKEDSHEAQNKFLISIITSCICTFMGIYKFVEHFKLWFIWYLCVCKWCSLYDMWKLIQCKFVTNILLFLTNEYVQHPCSCTRVRKVIQNRMLLLFFLRAL